MTSTWQIAALAAIGIPLGAGTTSNNPPLFFGQAHTLSISVGSTGAQAPNITLGYRDIDIAVVPVTITDAFGQVHMVRSEVGKTRDNNSLSVLGQFEATGAAAGVGLGKFFATGLAADKLADGFSGKLGNR